MSMREEFDRWAREGRDRGMEERHWHTAKHALARMPVEQGDYVVDLGTGSGYALRALRDQYDVDRAVGVDRSSEMLANARGYTEDSRVDYVQADFASLPFPSGSFDHAWSMEAFFYASRPIEVLREVRRVLRSGGTFYCAVNFFEESEHTHRWQDELDVEMLLWSREHYRDAFRRAGFYVAEQDCVPDRDVEIPPSEEFPLEEWDDRAIGEWETREQMVDRYRRWGTLLTVGVAP
ncbi:MAG: class I SAM-dependent methyltransferase [Halobacteriota archaeon]